MGGVLCSHRSHGTGWCYIYIGTFCLFEGYGCLKDAETLWRTDCDLWKPWDSLSHFPSQKWEATEATETRPLWLFRWTLSFISGNFLNVRNGHVGWQRIIPDRLLRSQHVYSIHSHHRVVAKVKSHRADSGRPRPQTQLWWMPSLVGPPGWLGWVLKTKSYPVL